MVGQLLFYAKFINDSHNEDKQYRAWQYITDIKSCPLREMKPFAGIRFFNEVLPAPAAFCRTEQDNQDGT